MTFRATRAPSGDAAQYTAPYFMGITEGTDRVLTREAFSVPFEFAPGEASVTFTDNIKDADVVAKYGSLPYDYQVLVGLQITKEQLNITGTREITANDFRRRRSCRRAPGAPSPPKGLPKSLGQSTSPTAGSCTIPM